MEDAQPQASIVTTDGSSSLYRTSTWLVQHEKRSDERNAQKGKALTWCRSVKYIPMSTPAYGMIPSSEAPSPR